MQQNKLIQLIVGNVAEWLRRCPAKALGSARVGSNPAVVVFNYFSLLSNS